MQVNGATFDEVSFDDGRDPRQTLSGLLPWGVALAFGACMATWAIHERPVAAPPALLARADANTPASAANPYGALIYPRSFADSGPSADASARASLKAALGVLAVRSAAQLASALSGTAVRPYGTLVDPGFFQDARRADSPLQARLEAAPLVSGPATSGLSTTPSLSPPPKREVALLEEAAPLPPARPAELAPPAAPAQSDRRTPPQPAEKVARTVAPPPTDDRGIFEKLFGLGRAPSPAVAYAAPESHAAGSSRVASLAANDHASGLSFYARSGPPSGYDKFTAVYDISARTLYMPDGTRIEAHSGLGDRLDDPRFVNERMRGATPPHLYELTMREAPFHGVQALRLTPVGDGDVFGRAGLLAHPFMLGPNGDSNGCVSIADYDAFLRAYQQGLVKRLAVVAKLD
jgi:hypothetical protein